MAEPRTGPTSGRTPPDTGWTDDVILVEDDGTPHGRADRTMVHTADTPLHLAFSTYLFNTRGEVLVTRRALGKKTWPGVWTNSCCGHPRPGEGLEDAARRRIREELGLAVGPLTPLLPEFRYRATDASGIVENEICPVYAGFVIDDIPAPDPAEVAEWAWIDWDKFAAAVLATPQVYSPWAALQVPALVPLVRNRACPTADGADDLAATIAEVDRLLRTELADLSAAWEHHLAGIGVDVVPGDLTAWLGSLLVGQGKRIRVAMTHWGFVAAGGRPESAAHATMVRVAAALETLHLFALVHDDVMDDSDARRGHASAHVQAAAWHRAADARGDAEAFGRNLAILLGDLAHALADRLADGLPGPVRGLWYDLCVELIAGQRADLTGAAAGRRDRAHAEQVARLKSGRYTIERPLAFGALAAEAGPDASAALQRYGQHIGRAFALRDDALGVWGDPERTGKPAGDDLREGKATVLVSLAESRLTGPDAARLARLGTPEFSEADAAALATALRTFGVADEVERLISEAHDAALAALAEGALTRAGVAGLTEAARTIAWRDA
ncbi:isopentenyl-diphosphate Delta-isomerase [Propioniciclava soli]|uniref:Isopentenyl-diphosphate Delta-isomerase n=1 Tax=Propioniciclava soli TaxID=2775081 RepID=A0ABZ3C8D9_9ACTN|nr:isopentenyl-diphosphate Delta-isomerase [Propioniciclava soli]